MEKVDYGSDIHLCKACKSGLSAVWGPSSDQIQVHHSYEKLVGGKTEGCAVCGWIWVKHKPPVQAIEDPATPDAQGFSVTLDSQWTRGCTKEVTFTIHSPWVNSCVTKCKC